MAHDPSMIRLVLFFEEGVPWAGWVSPDDHPHALVHSLRGCRKCNDAIIRAITYKRKAGSVPDPHAPCITRLVDA